MAALLERYKGDAVIYGLPRGGVVTAAAVARALDAPLDLIVTHKIGYPSNPEFAIGAVTDDGESILDPQWAAMVPAAWVEQEKDRQLEECRRRRDTYLAGRTRPPVEAKVAIVVDDGIATGYTMEAAVKSVRKRNPSRIVVAAPVAPPGMAKRFEGLADDVVIVEQPAALTAIGQWYRRFGAVEDDEVLALLL